MPTDTTTADATAATTAPGLHRPTPYQVHPCVPALLLDDAGFVVADLRWGGREAAADAATAEFIASACNAYYDLIDSLKAMAELTAAYRGPSLTEVHQQALAVIAKHDAPPRDPAGSADACMDAIQADAESDHRDGGPGRT